MYLNNLTGKAIKDISFAGFMFTIPAGVSLAWPKFGEFLFKDIYKVQGDGGGVPPVVPATAAQWKGDRYVEVKRFPMDSTLIPARKDLMRIAKQRGIDKVTLEQWDEDETIENKTIVDAINDLEVPEEIKFPIPAGATVDVEAEAAAKAADDAITDTTVKVEPAPEASKQAPGVGKAAGAAKTTAAKKAAPKAPKTPKAPAN